MGIQIYYIHWSFQRGGEKGIKERWEREVSLLQAAFHDLFWSLLSVP